MSEAILGHNLVTLGSLATTRTSQHPHDGQTGGLQDTLVDRLKSVIQIIAHFWNNKQELIVLPIVTFHFL